MMVKVKKILFLGLTLTILFLAACSDDESINPVAAVVVDTAPPAVPTGLAAASSSTVIKLAWDDNTTNPDFQGFLVYRLAFGNAYLLTPVPINETRFVDQQPLGISCGYAVSAVDEAGNESGWLEVRYDACLENPEVRISK